MNKEIKNFGKVIEVLLVFLTLISLVLTLLVFTNAYHIGEETRLNDLLISNSFLIVIYIENGLLYLVSLLYIIDTIEQKKNIFLRLSFTLFSILTTIFCFGSLTNVVAKVFGII